MISKGVEHALHVMAQESGFEDMMIIWVSGNYCTDKKPAAIMDRWARQECRCGSDHPRRCCSKGSEERCCMLVSQLNISKNLIGSAMAGSIGGFNAHAANIVTADNSRLLVKIPLRTLRQLHHDHEEVNHYCPTGNFREEADWMLPFTTRKA